MLDNQQNKNISGIEALSDYTNPDFKYLCSSQSVRVTG